MKNELIFKIQEEMRPFLNETQLLELTNVLLSSFSEVQIYIKGFVNN